MSPDHATRHQAAATILAGEIAGGFVSHPPSDEGIAEALDISDRVLAVVSEKPFVGRAGDGFEGLKLT